MLFKDVEAGQLFRQDDTVWLKIKATDDGNGYNELDWCPENLRVDAIYELSYE